MLPVSRPIARLAIRLTLAIFVLGLLIGPIQVAFGENEYDDPEKVAELDRKAISFEQWPEHDWRSPGFVGVVDGVMYDPDCWPLQSVGANVPNLIYRESILQNLDWMRKNRVRWIRVFATGHREAPVTDAENQARLVRELTTPGGGVQQVGRAVGCDLHAGRPDGLLRPRRPRRPLHSGQPERL